MDRAARVKHAGTARLGPEENSSKPPIIELVRTLQLPCRVAAELLDDPPQRGRQFLDLLGLVS